MYVVCAYVYVYVYLYVYAYVYVYVYVCVYVYVYVHTYVYVYLFVHVYMYVHVYVHVHVCLSVHVFIYLLIFRGCFPPLFYMYIQTVCICAPPDSLHVCVHISKAQKRAIHVCMYGTGVCVCDQFQSIDSMTACVSCTCCLWVIYTDIRMVQVYACGLI